jgi:hypothetical protein
VHALFDFRPIFFARAACHFQLAGADFDVHGCLVERVGRKLSFPGEIANGNDRVVPEGGEKSTSGDLCS